VARAAVKCLKFPLDMLLQHANLFLFTCCCNMKESSMFPSIVHTAFAHLIAADLLVAGTACFFACVNLRTK
jgi:hypothetical protein